MGASRGCGRIDHAELAECPSGEDPSNGASPILPDPLEAPGIELFVILAALAASAAFAALEGALAAFGDVRLIAAEEEGGRNGATASRILAQRRTLMMRLFTGRLAFLVTAVGMTVCLTVPLGPWWITVASLAGLAFLYAALAVGLGVFARARAAKWTLPMARVLRPLELLVWPLAAPLVMLAEFLERRFPPAELPQGDGDHAVREVEHMIEQREESGSIPEDFAELLLSVLEFKDTVAREVMVPRTQMKAIEIETTVEEALSIIVESGHSRYPVYRDRIDQIEGILYAKDLFRIVKSSLGNGQPRDDLQRSLDRIIRRPVFFVAETHKIGQLLREMQSRRFHLAVVVDEFGGTSGIVTLEDILEEIVGDIRDEHDSEDALVQELGEGWLVDASISIYDLGEILDVDFEEDEGDYDSLGGMLVELADGVPRVGEAVDAHGYRFLVREADERHVTRVEVRRAPQGGPVEAAAE